MEQRREEQRQLLALELAREAAPGAGRATHADAENNDTQRAARDTGELAGGKFE